MTQSPRPFDESELLTQMHWVRGVALALVKDPHVADDLAQDAWLVAQRSGLADEHGIPGLRAWFATLLRRGARRHRHDEDERRRREGAAATERAASPEVDVVERGELQRRIFEAVMELDEPMRGAILLRYLDGLSALDVARIQGVSHDAARKRISRGLEMLRSRLDRAHEGRRETWMHAVQAFLQFSPPAQIAVPAHSGVAGVLIAMSIKVALSAAVVALAAVALWSWIDPERTPEAELAATASPGDEPRLFSPRGTEQETPRAPAMSAATSAAGVFEVVDEGGRALPDLCAVLVVDGELAQATHTDAGGRARFDVVPQRSELLVGGRGRELARFPALGSLATERVILPAGATVGGHVRFPSDAPLPRLRLEHDVPGPAWTGLGPKALEFLARSGVRPASLDLEASADGAFAFNGLERTWTGALLLDGPGSIAEITRRGAVLGAHELLLLEPANDIVLAVRRPLSVRGRVVDGASRRPIAHAHVRMLAGFADRSSDRPCETSSDAEGGFELSLPAPDPAGPDARFLLAVSTADGRVDVRRTLVARAGETGIDAGTIELDLGRSIEIVARTSEGDPLAGARANAKGATGAPPSAPSNEDGRTQLSGLGANVRRIVVGAPGHRTVEVALPAGDVLEVVLPKANVLEVRVVDPDGRAASDVRVRVECARSPFRASGDAAGADAASAAPFSHELDVDEEGRLVLSDLVPHTTLALTPVDGTGSAEPAVEVRTPAEGARERVELVLARAAFRVAGTVRDERGRALPRCTIAAEWEGGSARARTDGAGRFSLGAFRGSVAGVHVEVSRPGFVTSVVEHAVLDSTTAPLDVVLVKARTLRARLVQEGGKPFDASTVLATFDDGRADLGHAVEAGLYEFAQAPPVAGRVEASLGTAVYAASFGPVDAEVVVRAPRLARITLHLLEAGTAGEGARSCAAVSGAEAGAGVERHYFKKAGDAFAPIAIWLPEGTYRVQLERRTLPPKRTAVEHVGAAREIVLAAGDDTGLTLP